MRYILIISLLALVLFGCKKDKFQTTPQIKFISLSPNFAQSDITSFQRELAPKLTFKITDAEGDFGSSDVKDSSMIYVKHLLSNNIDSFRFPDLSRASKNDFEAEVTINLFDALDCYSPAPPRPRTDTVYYEFYVRDAKKNKSNVVKTPTPLLYRCL
jgi:hypothetical protein